MAQVDDVLDSPPRKRKHHRHRHRHHCCDGSRSRSVSPEPVRDMSRRRASLYWDVAPPGYEHVTPAQYKAMRALGVATDTTTAAAGAAGAGISVERQARRLFVGNIPLGVTADEIMTFFNQQMSVNGLTEAAGAAVLSCQINVDKHYAFLEFRCRDECTGAMAFDGITLQGQTLKIRRPHDYQPAGAGAVGAGEGGEASAGCERAADAAGSCQFVATVVRDSPHKLFVGGVPSYLSDAQIRQLLADFGQLRAFHLVRDTASGLSRGFAFCEFVSTRSAQLAIGSLNGLRLADRQLVVQYASVGARGSGHQQLQLEQQQLEPSEVLSLLNMVTADELRDDEEYEDIVLDIREECSRYGLVRSIEIPRPIDGVDVPGLGKVFVEFATTIESQRAQQNLAGRKFGGRVVVTSFVESERYHRRDF